MLINGSDPIDGESVNDVYTALEKVKDKLINLMWRNSSGANDKTIKSLDGKRLQVIAGVVPVNDRTSKNDETSIEVKFYNAFGGGKDPTVVAMPESSSPYGVSVKKVTKEGFILVIHQFPDNAKDDKLNLSRIHYIAVGLP
jgi:hypothetical protein